MLARQTPQIRRIPRRATTGRPYTHHRRPSRRGELCSPAKSHKSGESPGGRPQAAPTRVIDAPPVGASFARPRNDHGSFPVYRASERTVENTTKPKLGAGGFDSEKRRPREAKALRGEKRGLRLRIPDLGMPPGRGQAVPLRSASVALDRSGRR